MSFHHPHWLRLLAVPVLWCFWQWVRRGRAVVLPLDHGRQGRGGALRFFTNVAGTAPSILLAVAVLLLAGPRKAAPPKDVRVMNNIILCVDVSGSMQMRFGNGTRYSAAVEAARAFCHYRKGDAFGLTIFGNEYVHWVPPTPELSAISGAMDYIDPRRLPFGGTMIALALRGCRDELKKTAQDGDKAVILITDGESADFGGGGDRAVAEEMAEAGIRVFGIVIDGDSAGLETITSATRGKLFTVGDRSALTGIFAEIDRMQKARFKQVSDEWVDDYIALAIAGLSVAVLYALSLLGLRYNPW